MLAPTSASGSSGPNSNICFERKSGHWTYYLLFLLDCTVSSIPMRHHKRDDKGEFYVEPDCCLLCGVPEAIAPDLFETGENHCWVKRQPDSKTDFDKAIEAMWSAEVDCIRYSGSEKTILRRLGEAGLTDLADNPSVHNYQAKRRNYVRFSVKNISSSEKLSALFRADMKKEGLKVLPRLFNASTVTMSWYRWNFHSIRFGIDNRDSFYAELRSINALTGLAWKLESWLSDIGVDDMHWLTMAEFKNHSVGISTPI